MHKKLFILSLAMGLAGFHVDGQLPPTAARLHSVSIDVKVVGSGGAGNAAKSSKDEHGRYVGTGGQALSTTTFENKTSQVHRTVLSIAVRNFSTTPDDVQLEWYFFGEQVGSTKNFIFDSSTKKVALQAGETQTIEAVSKEAQTATTQKMTTAAGYSPLYVTQHTGTKLTGWMVRMVDEGKVVQVRASTLKYEEIGKDDAKLQAMKTAHPRKK